VLGVQVPPGLPVPTGRVKTLSPGNGRQVGNKQMNKLKHFVEGIRTFFSEVRVELKKCAWPGKDELMESTIVVIVSVAIVAVFVGASDLVLMGLLRIIIR
jgi:preprotein translocase subunit SecE